MLNFSRKIIHALLLIKIFPNVTIKSHAMITMIAAPHLYLSRSFAPIVSFVTDAWVVGVLVTLASVEDSALVEPEPEVIGPKVVDYP